jgi:acetyltransferase-like isoleucine patch superfamily enzyme
MITRFAQMLRVLASGGRQYSPVAYAFGALLPGRRGGAGPVAWLRGWPMPDVRAGAGAIELGHVGLYPGVKLHCRGAGRMVIGDGTFLNRDARIFAGGTVTLGRHCMVSWQTVITDFAGFDATAQFAPVVLEDEVWIGNRAIILGGTRLGRGCVVAAGAVVQGDFPAGSILAGKPAEIVS